MNAIRCLLLCVAVASNVTNAAAAEKRPDLRGRVAHDDGSPVPAATVFIYTAGPKEGPSSLCPSCYADCRKRTKTDADGRFTIESLDPALLFRLLIVAPGHESRFVSKVNPAAAEPKVALKALSQESLNSPRRITGVVIDEHGKPAVGAVISPEGVQYGTSTRWGGSDEFVDPVVVADEQGHFFMQCKKEIVTAVHAVVEARNAAKRWVELKPGGDHFIRLQEGVAVTGQIEREDKPLDGVMVGLITKDREAGKYLTCDPIATDKNGRFLLMNVPPGREFVWYATMQSLKEQGAVKSKIFTTGKTGTDYDLGKLKTEPAFRIAGRIVLTDGKPIPAGVRLILGMEDAADFLESPLDAEGRFEFKNVPAESVYLSVRIRGYKFSTRNPNLDTLNGNIVGRVDQAIGDLTLLLEPGEWRSDGGPILFPGTAVQPQDMPLRSAK